MNSELLPRLTLPYFAKDLYGDLVCEIFMDSFESSIQVALIYPEHACLITSPSYCYKKQ